MSQFSGIVEIANQLHKSNENKALAKAFISMISGAVIFFDEAEKEYCKSNKIKDVLGFDEYCTLSDLADLLHVLAYNLKKSDISEEKNLAGCYLTIENSVRKIIFHSMKIQNEYSISYLEKYATRKKEMKFVKSQ